MAAIECASCSPDVEDDGASCRLFQCFCCWRKCCPPHIPPGKEYVCTPADGNYGASWSVLVGCTSAMVPFHNLRLHRFYVSASGQITGHNNQLLEPLLTVSPDDNDNYGNSFISNATTTMASDGLRLYGVYTHVPGANGALCYSLLMGNAELQPLQSSHKAFSLDLANKSLSALPPLPFVHGTYLIVTAHGGLWVPSIEVEESPNKKSMRLVMRLLEHNNLGEAAWANVASVDIKFGPLVNSHLTGTYLQGYAVVGNRFILLSLMDTTFFCFDCAAGSLTTVTTTGKSYEYTPISGKAVHLGCEDGMFYFLKRTKLLAYKFSPEEGMLLAPPVEVDRLWPYDEEGYGSVVHLTDRMLCAVWINMDDPCGCARRHALITTFIVKGGNGDDGCFAPSGVEVLHSTCRSVDMLRRKEVLQHESLDTFCFLQEFLDDIGKVDAPVHSSNKGGCDTPQVEEESIDNMPRCCRDYLSRGAAYIPILLEQCKSATRPDYYFICQVTDRSQVYHVSTIGGKLTCHEELMEPLLSLETITPGECGIDEPPSWHFVNLGSKLYVIPSVPSQNHYEVDVNKKLNKTVKQERPDMCFTVVSRAGQHIVALGDTLNDVYILEELTLKWLPFRTSSGSLDLTWKVDICGLVDLIDDALVVSDAGKAGCFLLDLRKHEWFFVKPPWGMWNRIEGALCGKCLFAEGFIYTCTGVGFAAFELITEDTSAYSLGRPVLMEFPYSGFPDRKLVSFDSISTEDNPSYLVFCVVQGNFMTAPFKSHHKLTTTTVKVKLEGTRQGRKVPLKIDHVDIS